MKAIHLQNNLAKLILIKLRRGFDTFFGMLQQSTHYRCQQFHSTCTVHTTQAWFPYNFFQHGEKNIMSDDKIVCRSRMITCSSFKFRKEMVGYDLRRYWFRLLWEHFFASHVFRCFFMVIFYDHAVVVIDGVCVQKLKILFNAGTSQSVLSTPKDLLQICTGQHNIYHNIHVYGN